MQCSLKLLLKDGQGSVERTFTECLGFVYEKALYVPYTKFSGVFFYDGNAAISACDVLRVDVALDNVNIHCGMPDSVTVERYGYGKRIRVTSRGYTLLLAQNEPYPRINTNVTLRSLCTANLVHSKIDYEMPTPVVSNVYVKEGSTVWEAAVAYCIKASGNYPYIRRKNTVMMTTAGAGTVDHSRCTVTRHFDSIDSSMILSDVYMQGLDDTYPYEAHDSSAAEMEIVRTRYYPLDMQWLYDPQEGLQHKLDYSNRAVRAEGMTYEGWRHEDIMYKASGGLLSGRRINRLRITGGRKGVFTTVWAYDDRYGQREEEQG
ncbi:hypothetical protein [uncultured Ruminococcus sp.]|uniref:hypothetical protein n=1 Tax=uncultured Ruminococcus sp. TaxID=165186 RepID=UPI0025D7DE9E|nr:hypothetical protein [uncultured Ruminococcus sp.]